MDPVTNALIGWCIARTGIAGDSRPALAAIVAASLVADIDIVHLVGGVDSYIRHGGTWSHSLLGATLLGGACAAGLWALAKRRKVELPVSRLVMACILASLVHVLLDAAASSGIALLYPLSSTRTALDWMPMTDMLLLVLFAVAFFLPWLFSLIQDEIGARRKKKPRWGAYLAIAGLVLIVTVRAINHDSIARQMTQQDYGDRTLRKIGVFPVAANPFRWRGIAETGGTLEHFTFDVLRGQGEQTGSYFKPAANPAMETAQQEALVKTFLLRARFPRASVNKTPDGRSVEITDLTCPTGQGLCMRFTTTVELDSAGKVRKTSIRWGLFATER